MYGGPEDKGYNENITWPDIVYKCCTALLTAFYIFTFMISETRVEYFYLKKIIELQYTTK